jgi:hypothetical protein
MSHDRWKIYVVINYDLYEITEFVWSHSQLFDYNKKYDNDLGATCTSLRQFLDQKKVLIGYQKQIFPIRGRKFSTADVNTNPLMDLPEELPLSELRKIQFSSSDSATLVTPVKAINSSNDPPPLPPKPKKVSKLGTKKQSKTEHTSNTEKPKTKTKKETKILQKAAAAAPAAQPKTETKPWMKYDSFKAYSLSTDYDPKCRSNPDFHMSYWDKDDDFN